MVILPSGERRRTPVADVRRGDELCVAASDGGGGGSCGGARVRCVVRIARMPEQPPLVTLPGGLHITAGHPIRWRGRWCRPVELPTAGRAAAGLNSYVYNFVLERSHVLLVDGVECVTWVSQRSHPCTDAALN